MHLKMEKRFCPVCNSNGEKIYKKANFNFNLLDKYSFSSRKLPEYMHYRLMKCENCDLVYASPIPSTDFLNQQYNEADFDTNLESEYASISYVNILLKFIDTLPDLNGVIDIGAGDGAFLEQLLNMKFNNIIGIEPSEAPVNSAHERVKNFIKRTVFSPDSFSDNAYSMVTCFQTIEHLYNPLTVCRGIHKKLKKNGALFIICHNRKSIVNILLGEKSPIFDVEHLQIFSKKSAKNLLKKAGYKDIRIINFRNKYPINYWLKLFPINKTIKQNLILFLDKVRIGKLSISIPVGNFAIIGYKK